MILIDASCWITFFLDERGADRVGAFLAEPSAILVPTLVTYEVFRHLLRRTTDKEALHFTAQMEACISVSIDHNLALSAAELSLKHNLGMADAIIYATALSRNAKLVTMDNDFRALPHCQVLK